MSRAKEYLDGLVADDVTVIVSPGFFRLIGSDDNRVYDAMDECSDDYSLEVEVFEYFGLL